MLKNTMDYSSLSLVIANEVINNYSIRDAHKIKLYSFAYVAETPVK